MKRMNRLVGLTAIAGIALALPAVTNGSPDYYAYQPMSIKLTIYFEGAATTNGSSINVAKAAVAKINNNTLIQRIGQLTGNSFSSKARLMVRSRVNPESYLNTYYTPFIVDGGNKVDVHNFVSVTLDEHYNLILNGKADLAKDTVAFNYMAPLSVGFQPTWGDNGATWLSTYGCGKGETAKVKSGKDVAGYVQHWEINQMGSGSWEGDSAVSQGTVSIGHVDPNLTEVAD